jgi:hypothetical protein
MLVPCGLLAADTTTNSELKLVESALQPVLEKLNPKPEISYPSSSSTLLVSYKPQMYKIHGRSMDGEVSPNAHDELGPSFKGFVLKVHLQEKGDVNQAVTPQTLRAPYWQTDLDVTPLTGTQKQIFWGLSYGSRADTNLLTQVRKTLHELKNRMPTDGSHH